MILELLSLFIISLLAATILPAQSEILLTVLYLSGNHDVITLILVATLGNVLGSVINYYIGRSLTYLKSKKWFPIKTNLDKATKFYNKYGIWTALFAWVPFIGDPLTIVAGVLRANFLLFLILVTIGKCGRYIFFVWLLSLN